MNPVINEFVNMHFRTSRDGRYNVRVRDPRANVTRATLNMPIELLTNGTQYFNDEIGVLTDFIEANRETVTDLTVFQAIA